MNSTSIGYLWCIFAALASAGASFLIKYANNGHGTWTLMHLVYLGGACITYAFGFVCYTVALQKLPMTQAYPVMTVATIALVTLLGYSLLGEALGTSRILGLVLISVGVFAVTR